MLSSVNKYRSQIMGFAAVWILLYHEWQSVFPAWSKPYYVELFITGNGFIGVDMFLLLSGMGLTYAYGKYSLTRFYIRRYGKLVIPVLAAAVGRVFVSGWSFPYFLKCLCGYSFIVEDVTVFLWYVYAIAIFYLFFPLYYHFFARSKNKYLFFGCAVAVWFVCARLLIGHLRDTSFIPFNRVPVFLLGILFGYMERSGVKPDRRIAVPLCAVSLVAGAYLEYYCGALGRSLLLPMPTVFLPAMLFGVSLVLVLAVLFEKLGKGGRILKFFGGISLELYCLQEVMGEYLIPRLSARLPALTVNAVFIAAVTLCAFGLHMASAIIQNTKFRITH